MTGTRIKILVVVPDLNVGGAETHISRIFPMLDRNDFDVRVYTIVGLGPLASVFRDCGIEVVCGMGTLNFPQSSFIKRKILLLWSALRYLLFLLKFRPDVVHFFLPLAYMIGGLGGWLLRRPNLVMSRRSLNNYQLKYPFILPIERFLHRRMRLILGNSRAVVENLVSEGAGREKISLLYNGIAISKAPSLTGRMQSRQSLDIASEDFVLIIVANLIPYKGHADLLEALAIASPQWGSTWKLLCVGNDSAKIRRDLEEKASELGIQQSVQFLGLRRDVQNLYAAADVGLLVSHEEGFSNSVLEGMVAQLPMIVTDVGGNAEAIESGEHGLVVPPKNPEALAQALTRLFRDADLRRRMGLAAREKVHSQFSLDRCVRAYVDVYRDLAGAK